MIFDGALVALATTVAGAGFFYVWPLRKNFLEVSGREKIFSRRGAVLSAEKHAVLENIDAGVITCDRDGRITYINSRAQAWLKLKNTSILSKSIKEASKMFSNDLIDEIDKLVDIVRAQKERTRTFVPLNQSEKALLEIIVVPSEDEHGVSVILNDRSNQHKMIEMGKEFIANASHELRTPVTIIRGFAETLKDLPEISEEMFDSILNKIIRNCGRIEILVKNLLMLADLDSSSEIQLKECSLLAIIDDSCNTLLNVSPNVHIEQLQNDDNIMIWGDTGLLELAIFNLLKNAVKYSSTTAEIKITIDASEEVVEIKIEDKGIGIPERELEKIFDRFYTVDKSHSRQLGGAGLGLSIVKTIINKHDGKIWATSKVGVGTTFHIVLSRL